MKPEELNMSKAIKALEEGKDGAVIILTEKGMILHGKGTQIISLATSLLNSLYANNTINDSLLEEMVKLTKMNNKELTQEALRCAKDFIEKLKNKN